MATAPVWAGSATIDNGDTETVSNGDVFSSTSLYVGKTGEGTLAIDTGGQVQTTSTNVGYQTGATGLIAVTDIGSHFKATSLALGYNGHGVLDVTNGATVWTTGGYLGRNAGATGHATLDGSGTSWRSTGLNVGYWGDGTLELTDGASIQTTGGDIGGTYTVDRADDYYESGDYTIIRGATGTGYVTLRGGSTWTSNGMGVGVGGDGVLEISDGSRAAANSYDIGYFANGEVLVADRGTFTSQRATLGRMEGSSGQVTVQGEASTWTPRTATLGLAGASTVNLFDGGTMTAGWYVTCGEFSTIAMELMTPGIDAPMSVGRELTLDGTLNVMMGDYMPQIGDGFDLLDWGRDLTGEFAEINLPVLQRGMGWDTSSLYETGEIFMLQTAVDVPLDIKLGSNDNPVNPKSKGMLPVTLFGTDLVDVSDIDLMTLVLNDVALASKPNGSLFASFDDMDGDGLMDLAMKFRTQDLNLDSTFDELVLFGFLSDGTEIMGSDLIGIVPDGFAGISQDAAPTFGMMTGAAIPEPATMGLLVLGGTALLRRRKK